MKERRLRPTSIRLGCASWRRSRGRHLGRLRLLGFGFLSKRNWDPASDSPRGNAPVPLDEDAGFLASRMCGRNPEDRVTAVSVVWMLEDLVAREGNAHQAPQLEPEPTVINVGEYQDGALTLLWSKVRDLASQHDKNALRSLVLQEIEATHEQLVRESRPRKLFDEFYQLLVDSESVMRPGSYQNRVVTLSSTRATSNNLNGLRRRIGALRTRLDGSQAARRGWNLRWEAQRKKQLDIFVSEVSQTMMVLNDLDDEEDRRAFIAVLKTEIDGHASNYTEGQLSVMKQAYEDIL